MVNPQLDQFHEEEEEEDNLNELDFRDSKGKRLKLILKPSKQELAHHSEEHMIFTKNSPSPNFINSLELNKDSASFNLESRVDEDGDEGSDSKRSWDEVGSDEDDSDDCSWHEADDERFDELRTRLDPHGQEQIQPHEPDDQIPPPTLNYESLRDARLHRRVLDVKFDRYIDYQPRLELKPSPLGTGSPPKLYSNYPLRSTFTNKLKTNCSEATIENKIDILSEHNHHVKGHHDPKS